MVPIISLLIVLILSILVTRIATVALAHTGLSRESARFQARSAFTGVGFTTTEAERVVNHPARRQVVLMLMLLGNAGIVTAISSLILGFISPNEAHLFNLKIILLIAGLSLLWAAAQSNWIDYYLSLVISRLLKRYTRLDIKDYANLLQLAGDYQVSELRVQAQDWLAHRSLAELDLNEEGILVLGIHRQNGEYLGVPRGQTQIRPEDTLILYGRVSGLEELDTRERGLAGDQAHDQAVAAQAQHVAAEKEL